MLGILFPFACLFGAGLYFILADFLKVPTLATTKAVIAVTRREKKQAKSLEAMGNGSYHSLIPAAAKAFGLNVVGDVQGDPQKIVDALSSGKLVIALMSKGHFTSSGHFIVLRGVTADGKILVADPASKSRSEQEWDFNIILDEARKGAAAGGAFWIIG